MLSEFFKTCKTPAKIKLCKELKTVNYEVMNTFFLPNYEVFNIYKALTISYL